MIPVGRAQGGHIEARCAVQGGQQGHPISVQPLPAQIHEVGHSLLPLADQDHVEEGGQGFRVHGDAGTPGDQQRPGLPVPLLGGLAIRGQGRHLGLAQHLHHIEVVHLPGDGEGPDVELIRRPSVFQRKQGLAGVRVALGPEDALADHVRVLVEAAVEDLERQAAHPHIVAVGEGEGHGPLAAPILEDCALFPQGTTARTALAGLGAVGAG